MEKRLENNFLFTCGEKIMNTLALEITGHINILLIILGGLFIICKEKKRKLMGMYFYFACNFGSLLMFYFSGLKCFLSSFAIFFILNTINIVRIIRQ